MLYTGFYVKQVAKSARAYAHCQSIITHLQELYDEQSHTAHFEVSKRLFNLKIRERQFVHKHCMTVIKDIEEPEKLGLDLQKKL